MYAQTITGKLAKGKNELIAHLSGKKISKAAAIKAKCYECTNWYADGKEDCLVPSCPLYQHMPMRKGKLLAGA
jgi:hypothetical protein